MKEWQRLFSNRHRDLNEEIESHIEMAVRDRIDRGELPEEARSAAVREFGNIALIQDVDAYLAGGLWMDRLWGDLRYAWRQLHNAPGFAVTAILTLALGIGSNTAIFTLVHAILLRQLPFREPSRVLSVDNIETTGLTYDIPSKNYAASFDSAARSFKTIDSATMYSSSGVNVAWDGRPAQRLRAAETSAQFLNVLGVTPSLGRGFLSNEDVPGNDRIALISHRLWQEMFHADPAVLGKHIRINEFDFVVIGVLPVRMDFPANTDLWAPTIFDEHTALHEAGAFMTSVLVRARSGTSIAAVRAEFNAHAVSMTAQNKRSDADAKNSKPVLTPIAADLTKSIRSALLTLTVAVSFVLFIACANVASLALVRTAKRRAEFAVRAALGATRRRLVLQQLVEYGLIAVISGVLGVCLAFVTLQAIYAFRPANLLAFPRPHIDLIVLGFTAAIAIATGLIFGLAPAWLAGREDPMGALKTGVWRTSRHGARFQKMLVAAEVGIAFVLLTGAGLLLRTMANTDRVPLGYDVNGLLSFSVSLHGKPYDSSDKQQSVAVSSFYSNVLEGLTGTPGVTATAAVSSLPLETRADMLLPISAQDRQQQSAAAAPRIVSTGYFSAMGMPLVQGRDFSRNDTSTTPMVAIITSDLAAKLWPNQSPLGHRLACAFFCKAAPIVIGVVHPNRRFGPRSNSFPEYYVPYTQHDWPYMSFVVRTTKSPAMLIPSMRRVVAQIDPTQPIYNIETMQERLNDNQSLIRFELVTLSVFAVLAAFLVLIGLYGVISYTVAQRTREIGLRIALGAPRESVLMDIFREGVLIALIGIVGGILSSLELTRLLEAVLFGVTPHDPATLCTVSLLFLGIAMLASFLPAHRAAGIHPAQTLRLE